MTFRLRLMARSEAGALTGLFALDKESSDDDEHAENVTQRVMPSVCVDALDLHIYALQAAH
jgi:hypothetical protein